MSRYMMNPNMCDVCKLVSTVEIMPIVETLYKDGHLTQGVFQDIHVDNMQEGLKWKRLLQSLNLQENQKARRPLIEQIRLKNPQIADVLEATDDSDQLSCTCGPPHSLFNTENKNDKIDCITENIVHRTNIEEVSATPTNKNPVYQQSQRHEYLDINSSGQLLVFIFIIVCLIATGLYFLPTLFVTGIIVLVGLHLYFKQMRQD